jgi:hypothetical protein
LKAPGSWFNTTGPKERRRASLVRLRHRLRLLLFDLLHVLLEEQLLDLHHVQLADLDVRLADVRRHVERRPVAMSSVNGFPTSSEPILLAMPIISAALIDTPCNLGCQRRGEAAEYFVSNTLG